MALEVSKGADCTVPFSTSALSGKNSHQTHFFFVLARDWQRFGDAVVVIYWCFGCTCMYLHTYFTWDVEKLKREKSHTNIQKLGTMLVWWKNWNTMCFFNNKPLIESASQYAVSFYFLSLLHIYMSLCKWLSFCIVFRDTDRAGLSYKNNHSLRLSKLTLLLFLQKEVKAPLMPSERLLEKAFSFLKIMQLQEKQ